MTPSIVKEYNEAHKDSEYLGRICWFSVREQPTPHGVVESELRQVGLDKWAPKNPAPIDVFRKVTTAAQRKRVDGPNGVRFNVLVRQVDDNDRALLRRIVVETIDQKGKRLDYTEAYDLTFDRDHETISTSRITTEDFGGVDDAVAAEIRDNYLAQRGCVDANAIRATIKKVLDEAEAVQVRETGGVAFVSRHRCDLVDQLGIVEHGGVTVHVRQDIKGGVGGPVLVDVDTEEADGPTEVRIYMDDYLLWPRP